MVTATRTTDASNRACRGHLLGRLRDFMAILDAAGKAGFRKPVITPPGLRREGKHGTSTNGKEGRAALVWRRTSKTLSYEKEE